MSVGFSGLVLLGSHLLCARLAVHSFAAHLFEEVSSKPQMAFI